jgi:peptidoglycan-associated lipoprotein
MEKNMKISLVTLAVAALFAGGCAKQQVIKQDQIIPPTAPVAATAKPAAKPEAKGDTKDAGLASAGIKEAQPAKQAVAPGTDDASLKQALEKVFFDFDSSTLSADARQALAKNAELLKKKGDVKVRIEGNCDELGSDDYNLALGQKRAAAAKSYLQTMGVAPERLSTISYGKEKPAVTGHDDAARAKNRRDEFVITSSK